MANCKPPTAGISNLLKTGEYSDVTLQCGDRVFKVHKAIVCTQSEFLARACRGPFKEAATGVIDLPDEDPEIVAKALSFFYTSDYDYDSSENHENSKFEINNHTALDAQLMNVAVFALADRWLVPELEDLAVEKFKSLAMSFKLWIHGVPEVLRAIYTSTPQSNPFLRSYIIRLCVYYSEDLSLLTSEGVGLGVLAELPDAHIDLLKETLSAREAIVSQLTADKDRLENENTKLRSDIVDSIDSTPKHWPIMASRLNDLLSESCRTCQLDGIPCKPKIVSDECNFGAPHKIQVQCSCGRKREKHYR